MSWILAGGLAQLVGLGVVERQEPDADGALEPLVLAAPERGARRLELERPPVALLGGWGVGHGRRYRERRGAEIRAGAPNGPHAAPLLDGIAVAGHARPVRRGG